MRVLIFSDTHRRTDSMLDFIHQSYKETDLVIHLGDTIDDAQQIQEHFPAMRLICVPGNSDYDSGEQREQVRIFGDARALILHGHTRYVKSGLSILEAFAQSVQANVVLFGHTHEPYAAYSDGIYYLNPGAASGYNRSCGVLEIRGKQILTNIVNI